MATVSEAYAAESGSDGQSPSVDVSYRISGAATFQAAMAALYAQTPSTLDVYGDLTRLLPKAAITVENINDDYWNGVVTYAVQPVQPIAPPEGPSEYSGDANGGTKKLLRSIETIKKYPNDESQPGPPDPPDQHGYIGKTKDGYDGVDIIAPGMNWTEVHYLPASLVTWDWIIARSEQRGTTNAGEFRDFPRGEVLLADFDWTRRGGGDFQCTFKFIRQKRETDTTIDWIEHIAKEGHEYAWVLPEEKAETSDIEGTDVETGIVSTARGVYIEKVYEESNFADLGIGTGVPF